MFGIQTGSLAQLQLSFKPFWLFVTHGIWHSGGSPLAPQRRACPSTTCLLSHPQALSLQGSARLQQHWGQTVGQPHSCISSCVTPSSWHKASSQPLIWSLVCAVDLGSTQLLLLFPGTDEKHELKEVRSLHSAILPLLPHPLPSSVTSGNFSSPSLVGSRAEFVAN